MLENITWQVHPENSSAININYDIRRPITFYQLIIQIAVDGSIKRININDRDQINKGTVSLIPPDQSANFTFWLSSYGVLSRPATLNLIRPFKPEILAYNYTFEDENYVKLLITLNIDYKSSSSLSVRLCATNLTECVRRVIINQIAGNTIELRQIIIGNITVEITALAGSGGLDSLTTTLNFFIGESVQLLVFVFPVHNTFHFMQILWLD